MSELNDVNFVDTDSGQIAKKIITVYESLSKRSLAAGDPIRLFLMSIADIIIQQRVLINYSAKQNLLAYADGDFLDHIGLLVGSDRIQPSRATTELEFTLSVVRTVNTSIPAGTRATADGTIFFATDRVLVIPAGELSAAVDATALESGTASNGLDVGEINIIVDPVPFVESVQNITLSDGGGDIETDEYYRKRIREAPEKYSTAGPSGAYAYHVKASSALVEDVAVTSPSPGCVNICPLLKNGTLPSVEVLEQISNSLNDSVTRPLTDKVTVLAPGTQQYNITLTYYIASADAANSNAIQAQVENAVNDFALWTRSKIGRDLNPTELYYRIRQAGAKRAEITEPVFTAVNPSSIAIANSITVNFGGLEDG